MSQSIKRYLKTFHIIQPQAFNTVSVCLQDIWAEAGLHKIELE